MHQIDLFHLNSVALIHYSYLFTGADITDYFNYGFTEDTWKAYQQRQHVLRSQGQAYHSNNTYGGGGGSGHHYHHHNNAQHQINVCVKGKLKVLYRSKSPMNGDALKAWQPYMAAILCSLCRQARSHQLWP